MFRYPSQRGTPPLMATGIIILTLTYFCEKTSLQFNNQEGATTPFVDFFWGQLETCFYDRIKHTRPKHGWDVQLEALNMPLARETIMWLMVSDTCSFHLHHLRPKMGYGKPVYSPPKECQHHPAFWDTVKKKPQSSSPAAGCDLRLQGLGGHCSADGPCGE